MERKTQSPRDPETQKPRDPKTRRPRDPKARGQSFLWYRSMPGDLESFLVPKWNFFDQKIKTFFDPKREFCLTPLPFLFFWGAFRQWAENISQVNSGHDFARVLVTCAQLLCNTRRHPPPPISMLRKNLSSNLRNIFSLSVPKQRARNVHQHWNWGWGGRSKERHIRKHHIDLLAKYFPTTVVFGSFNSLLPLFLLLLPLLLLLLLLIK